MIQRILVSIALAIFWGVPVLAQSQPELLAQAVRAAGVRDWVTVDARRAGLSNRSARDVIDWMRLRGRQGTFEECRDFLKRNADWPGLPLLRKRCEYTIPRGGDPRPVLEFFAEDQPQTGTGALRFAEASYRSDQTAQGVRALRRAWVSLEMSQAEHEAFVTRNEATLRDIHQARLDSLLWQGETTSAERMMPLVNEDWQKLARARLALRAMSTDVNALIEAVPDALQDDPGLAYERFLWRVRKGLTDRAIDLMLERSTSAKALGEPERWANQRRSLARRVMRGGDAVTAYALASAHFLTEGSSFADLEWLSGFLALRKLKSPVQSIAHFEAFRGAVATPISLGRAGYWLGRAHSAAGDTEAAARAYAFGAGYQSSFYGQLAAEAASLPTDPTMTGQEVFPDWRDAEFVNSSVFAAAMQLQAAGLRSLAERFLVHLGETQDRTGLGQLGQLALDLREPHIALMISKQAARMGHELYKTYFPLGLPYGEVVPVPMEFALAIARRESEFDPEVVSPVGARGLMQLMPDTAKEVADGLDLRYDRARLLSDPKYNAKLGSTYLAELAERFDNNPVLMSIGYNAGPSRAERWPEEYGDPRSPNVDIIDWIEGIPFRETRNYVMRVTESFAPYRARITDEVPEIRLTEDLRK